MLKRIRYVSVATEPFTDPQLVALIEKSRANNAVAGVTGGLMMAGSIFFQVLEGPPTSVDTVFARIRRDSRHGSIHLLRTEIVDGARMFGAWAMQLVPPEDIGLRDAGSMRSMMLRLEMAHRSTRQLEDELDVVVTRHFARR